MALVSSDQLAWMASVTASVLKENGNPSTVTYRRRTANSYDPTATSANAPTLDSQSITGTMIGIARDQDGIPMAGTLVFVFTVEDFEAAYASGVRPLSADTITYNSESYEVMPRNGEDPLGIMLSVTMKRVGA